MSDIIELQNDLKRLRAASDKMRKALLAIGEIAEDNAFTLPRSPLFTMDDAFGLAIVALETIDGLVNNALPPDAFMTTEDWKNAMNNAVTAQEWAEANKGLLTTLLGDDDVS